jgi:rfaE bifunctional protein kinase chain/domain
MLELIAKFRDCPILVIGDVMLDEFIWGQVNRISPEAPVPVVEVRRRSATVGGAGNTAANVRSLGGTVELAGVIGNDGAGHSLMEELKSKGIGSTGLLAFEQRPTTTKTRVVAGSQQMLRFDVEQPVQLTDQEGDELLAAVFPKLENCQACIVSDYGKGVVTQQVMRTLIVTANAKKIPILVDPKGRDYAKYAGATLVKPNQLEAGQVFNRVIQNSADVERAGQELLQLLGPSSNVLITRGASGMNLFQHGQPSVNIPTKAREVFDVTGAGDTVASALALCLGVGGSLAEACKVASLAAAVVVGKIGTATCSVEELLALAKLC